MELFIRDIPRSARKENVQLAISNALHGGAYSDLSTDPINFEFWFHTKANVAHRGTGSLTLPEQNIGRAFLARHGTQLSINGGRVMVSVSRNPARPHVVETLRRIPYKDPRDEAEQQIVALEKDLATKFKIENIKQGWMDRDGKFLSEYSISAANNPQIEGITLRIDDDTRSILLELSMRATDPAPTPNSDFLSMLSLLRSGSRRKLSYTIRFRYSDIYRITHDQAQGNSTRRILFQLKSPVSYEYFEDCGFSELFGSSNPPQKKRLSSLTFDARHKELANVVSKTILIRLKQEDVLQFKKLCKLGQIGRVRNGTIYAASSDSFSGSGLLSLRRWINGNKWEIAFQLERILTSMLLNPEEFNAIRPAIDELIATSSTSQVCAVLLDFIARLGVLDRGEDWEEEPPAIAECLERAKIQVRHPVVDVPRLRQTKKNDLNAEFPCLHVVVTPTRFILEGPAPEQLNRVLRMYPNNWRNFLRVRFTDEDQNQFRWERDIDGAAFVRERVGGILKNGLTVAGRHFEYLGYSNSSLKSHTVWFVHPFEDPERGMQDAKAIIERLGDFSRDIQCPARMGARIAQAFSSTDLSVTATAEELIKIPDIERNGSCFTDGVGTISPEFAEQIWESLTKLRKKRSYFLPAAYQIRLGGYKGMLAIDYRLEGSVVCVRDSMDKFDSPSVDVEVSRAFDRPGKAFCSE